MYLSSVSLVRGRGKLRDECSLSEDEVVRGGHACSLRWKDYADGFILERAGHVLKINTFILTSYEIQTVMIISKAFL